MLLPRNLIYQEKALEEFSVRKPDSIFAAIYKQLKGIDGMRPSDVGAKRQIEEVLNDACYIVTDALRQPNVDLLLGEYHESVNYDVVENNWHSPRPWQHVDATLAIVYVLLRAIHPEREELNEMIAAIATYLRKEPGPSFLFDSFYKIAENAKWTHYLVEDAFAPIHLDEELLNQTQWSSVTNNFDTQQIAFIVRNIGRSNAERLLVIESIRRQVEAQHQDELINTVDLPF